MRGKEKLKLLGWSLVFLVGGFVVATLVVLPLGLLFLDPGSGFLRLAAIQTIGLLIGFGVLSWLIGAKVLRLTRAEFEQLGPDIGRARRFGRFGWGAAVGTALAIIAMLIAVPLGHAAWQNDAGGPVSWLEGLALTAAVLLPAALAEELAFRGLPLLAVSRGVGRMPAILGLAGLFALAHIKNPSVTPVALINIALAGVFLSFVFFTPGGLWTSTGAHLGWNLTLAGLGAPVSGLPLPMPWLDYSPGGPEWLTGGSFGPEGGALASLCLLGGTILVGRRMGRKGAPSP